MNPESRTWASARLAPQRVKALWGSLSPALRSSLVVTLLATVAVLLTPASQEEGGASERAEPPIPLGNPPAAGGRPGWAWNTWLRREPPAFPEAEMDPFAAAAVPAPVVPVPVVAAPSVTAAPSPPPQTQFKVLGWLRVSGEAPQLLLSDGQVDVVATAGLSLPDGFVVRALEARSIVLWHPSTQTEMKLPVPDSVPSENGAEVGAR